jgi:fungal type III polyketide synthase
VVLTHRVPRLTCDAVPSMFEDLISSVPDLVEAGQFKASDCDWALHPGGATIISGIEKAMKLTPEHLRASYEVYMAHGNSSSATAFSVLKRLLDGETTEHIVSCAFGPGIAVEMVIFKRLGDSRASSDDDSPAETLVAEDVD